MYGVYPTPNFHGGSEMWGSKTNKLCIKFSKSKKIFTKIFLFSNKFCYIFVKILIMEKWMRIIVDKNEIEKTQTLSESITEENHISRASEEEIFSIYQLTKGDGIKMKNISIMVQKGDNKIIVYKNEEKIYWENNIDFLVREEFFNSVNHTLNDYKYGYITGATSHLDNCSNRKSGMMSSNMNPWYEIWQQSL